MASLTAGVTQRHGRAARLHGLYAVTPDPVSPEAHARWLDCCAAALEGGARAIQYRDKTSAPSDRSLLARALQRLAAAHDALFIVNDDAPLAIDCGADGVHLGRDDGSIADWRERAPGLLIGATCHATLGFAHEAVAAGADYVAFGAVFASSVKPGAVVAPLELLASARAALHGHPVVAIGGITRATAARVHAAGADACAVIADLFGAADDPAGVFERARAFKALLEPL